MASSYLNGMAYWNIKQLILINRSIDGSAVPLLLNSMDLSFLIHLQWCSSIYFFFWSLCRLINETINYRTETNGVYYYCIQNETWSNGSPQWSTQFVANMPAKWMNSQIRELTQWLNWSFGACGFKMCVCVYVPNIHRS